MFRSRTIEKKTDILLLEVVHTHKEREMLNLFLRGEIKTKVVHRH